MAEEASHRASTSNHICKTHSGIHSVNIGERLDKASAELGPERLSVVRHVNLTSPELAGWG